MNVHILFGKFMKIPRNTGSMMMSTKKTLSFLEKPIEKPFDDPPVKFSSELTLRNSFEKLQDKLFEEEVNKRLIKKPNITTIKNHLT